MKSSSSTESIKKTATTTAAKLDTTHIQRITVSPPANQVISYGQSVSFNELSRMRFLSSGEVKSVLHHARSQRYHLYMAMRVHELSDRAMQRHPCSSTVALVLQVKWHGITVTRPHVIACVESSWLEGQGPSNLFTRDSILQQIVRDGRKRFFPV